ncbi:hypothetical protein [Salinarimonas ramus]|uniref:TonB C-terminal domain-containing protein n=1 Tax=Salinarimonas ramus TaxID=690164 RepID=A0A917V6H6_9HYPH|nr:hypothetical protein [Salinarimonas ramus]GGK46176.1 hypothetical protein GCM10011322_36590 [Salinarimonas ramus]
MRGRTIIRAAIGLALLLAALVGSPAARAQSDGPIDTLHGLVPALTRCWDAPAGTQGHAVTVRLSLKRDGSLNGEPRITHSELPGDAATGRLFVASVLAALARCLPAPITDGLGGAIAGRPFTLRFVSGRAPEIRT